MNYFKKLTQKQSGFTLIELLIVVAIIAILSGVVLASLNGARVKAKNSKSISEMASMRAQAELYYNNNSFSYGTTGTSCSTLPLFIAGTDTLNKLMTSVVANVGGTANTACSVGSETWAFAALLPTGKAYCVDSTGASRETTATTAASAISSGACI